MSEFRFQVSFDVDVAEAQRALPRYVAAGRRLAPVEAKPLESLFRSALMMVALDFSDCARDFFYEVLSEFCLRNDPAGFLGPAMAHARDGVSYDEMNAAIWRVSNTLFPSARAVH
jgi:hypothetical protein